MATKQHRDLRIGDRVEFCLGVRTVRGEVVEDLGRLGAGKRQLVRVEVTMSPPYLASFIVRQDEITVIEPARRAAG